MILPAQDAKTIASELSFIPSMENVRILRVQFLEIDFLLNLEIVRL